MSTEASKSAPRATTQAQSHPSHQARNEISHPNPFALLADGEEAPDLSTSPDPHRKACSLCSTPRNVLIRCQINESRRWVFVCTGKCWKSVSGGFLNGTREYPDYKYGGMWKNKHAYVSAKIKGEARATNKELHGGFKQSRPHKKSMGRPGWQKEGRMMRDIDVGDLEEEQSGDPDRPDSEDDEDWHQG